MVLTVIFSPTRSRADIFGGDVIVLTQILVQAVQTVVQLRSILSQGKDTLDLLRDVNAGVKSGLDLIRIINPSFNPGVYGDLRDATVTLYKVAEGDWQVLDIVSPMQE